MYKVIVIVGPTAVGKTKFSVELAKRLNTEIISADSCQVHRYMDIGTAKVTKDEMDGVKHHLIDIVNPDEDCSVSQFQDLAKKEIIKLNEKNKIPIVIGGSGLFINSIMYDLNFGTVKSDEKIRKYFYDYHEKYGTDALHDLLKEIDPISAEKIHKNNVKRVVRALEVCELTGKKFSDFGTNIRTPSKEYDCFCIGLTTNRDLLYDRINKRVDMMINNGLIKEVDKLLSMGYGPDLTSMRAIGYKELIPFIKNEISIEEAIESIKLNSRRFAKRQFTWFNADKNINWLDTTEAIKSGNINLLIDKTLDLYYNI